MNLTDKILAGMHGRLDITVVRKDGPYVPLHVVGVSVSGLNYAWTDLPAQFRQDKMVYIVHGEDVQGREFIFAEDTHVIDAPASAVVDALMDLVGQINPDVADRVWYGEDGEVIDEDDWICEGAP